MRIQRDDLRSAEVVAFLSEHVAELRAVSPPGSSHALDLDGLRAPGVCFWTAVAEDGELLGCAALKELTSGHAELKSMRTATTRTRQGVATALLTRVLEEARAAGYERVSLETGSFAFFAPARALYARHGFAECGPFAGYGPDPASTFMTLALRP
ncbi:GNAT family N-acetyltransferase [Nocardioides sp. cx-169]|uniref:GNAT family N-acetyltransferase n=1 Tax=Nocardioides sp. cx-169 TaxID=2899080 RepID=UPI001E2B20D4|nr:GNAT family N-acetyltransferase [Nocardioides sp. cx-169]MCD4534841.1 GNAT family N-acetyltransferase [Nocardioides sp. cx-169]